jgi:uncharacterized glyoxalase superfamily protein PhnB
VINNETDLWQTCRLAPGVAYEDVPRAIEWLAGAFGFRERSEARLTARGFVLSWMELGDGLIAISTAGRHGVASPKRLDKTTELVRVYVDDIVWHFQRAKAAGARILTEIQEGLRGGSYYRAMDPEGHLWEFSQIGRDLSAE